MSPEETLGPCFSGNSDGTDCHKPSTLYYVKSQLKAVKEMSPMDKELLQCRSGLAFTEDAHICSYHNALLTKFKFLQNTSCNPFGKEKPTVKKGLQSITISISGRLRLLNNEVFKPGQKMCAKCRKELAQNQLSASDDEESASNYEMDVVDAYCTANT